MEPDPSTDTAHTHQAGPTRSQRFSAGMHDLNQQCLRILRCTAQALANSPGGLRFKAGTRPWLEGLSHARPVLVTSMGRPTASWGAGE